MKDPGFSEVVRSTKLKGENLSLRKELKSLNLNLTDLIELIKDYSKYSFLLGIDLKKKPMKELNMDMIKRSRQEELKNSDKMTHNLYHEYEQYQRRFETMSNPNYPSELRRKANELDTIIKTITKERKNLEVSQYRREKMLDKII